VTRRVLALCLALVGGCAQIESHSTIDVVPRPELEPRWLGEARTIVGRDLSAQWSQSLSTVELQLQEQRRCRAVLHEPVDRVESVDRTVKHGALYWEYGAGAALLAVGLAALIKPEAFSPQAVSSDGNQQRDTATGYRIGGIFTGLGAALVGVGAYDTVRSRDTVTTTRAYRLTTGDTTPCIDPQGPRSGVEVTLEVGTWTSTVETDAQGRVRFGLPTEAEMGITLPEPPPPPAPAEASEQPTEGEETVAPQPVAPPPPPAEVEATATVRVDGRTASFTILAPLSSDAARQREGALELVPQGVPRPQAAKP
jgi:hypothetical protein